MKLAITDIPLDEVLLGLYNHAKFQGVNYDRTPSVRNLGAIAKPASLSDAKRVIAERTAAKKDLKFEFADLGQGAKRLDVNLSEHPVDFTQYDLCHGNGAAQKIINNIRDRREKTVVINLGEADRLGAKGKAKAKAKM